MDVYVDGVGKRVVAKTSRPDVAAAYSGAGAAHGFSVKLPAKTGSHSVCVYAIDSQAGANTTLGCRTVKVP